jgi:GR25 family glycosyltransferase involved in LPS biosynthesis
MILLKEKQINTINNLYNFILQRNADETAIINYQNKNFDTIKEALFNSDEYKKINQNLNIINKPILPYTIISINDRAKKNIDNTKSILKTFNFKDLIYFNAKTQDINKFYDDQHIKLNWNKELHGRNALTGEYGIAASQIIIFKYMIDYNIDELIVFEDDAVIDKFFLNNFYACYSNLPNDWDYLADCSEFPHHSICEKTKKEILIGSSVICKSHLINAHLGFMLYSKRGAIKILNALKLFGLTSPIDTFIYNLSRVDYLNGYTSYFKNRMVVEKDKYGTLIDPENIRR